MTNKISPNSGSETIHSFVMTDPPATRVTAAEVRSKWNQDYFVEHFEENAYKESKSDNDAQARYILKNKRTFSGFTAEYTVCRETQNGKDGYRLVYTLSGTVLITVEA